MNRFVSIALALAVFATVGCTSAMVQQKAPPADNYKKVSTLVALPDFVPGLGFVDDVFVAAILVDGMLNYVNRGLVLKYWPGSADSLERVARAARVLAAWVPRRLKLRIFSSH